MKLFFLTLVFLASLLSNVSGVPTPPPVVNIKFVAISTAFNRPVMIQYHSPTDSFVASVNYPCGMCPCPGDNPSICDGVSNGTFERLLFDGSRIPFSNVIGLGDEVHIATVRAGNLGGFTEGDLFTGNGVAGQVTKITNNGATVNLVWTQLPSKGLLRGHLYSDRVGIFGGDLLVSTNVGEFFRVDVNGKATLLNSVGYLTEGLEVVPNDTARYGQLAGKLLGVSEVTSSLFAVDPHGKLMTWSTPACQGDNVNIIYPGDNFLGVNYGSGRLLGAQADQWAPLIGEILITCETWDTTVSSSGIFNVYWNDAANTIGLQTIGLTSDSAVPNHWEHVVFASGGLVEVLPFNFQLCLYTDLAGGRTKFAQVVLPPPKSVVQNYLYNTPIPFSYNGPSPNPIAHGVTIFITQDSKNVFFLNILVDKPGAQTGGSLTLNLQMTGPDFSQSYVAVQDDPNILSSTTDYGDFYAYNATSGSGSFKWQWGPSTGDGTAIGPIPIVAIKTRFNIQFTVASFTQLTTVNIVDGTTLGVISAPISLGQTFNIFRRSCTCGNGVVDDFEECDSNSTCCTSDCLLQPVGTVCNSTSNICLAPSLCSGQNDYCPPLGLAPLCNCTFPYYGPGCIYARCDYYSNCSSCGSVAACGWCCSTGSCLQRNSTSGTQCPNQNFQSKPCFCNPSCQNGGICTCGSCVCSGAYTGADCSLIADCTGQLVPANGIVKTVDVCNVCGGNGTSCLGCDGKPFGLKLDRCGICGGDGTNCTYNTCKYGSCYPCLTAEGCTWCETNLQCLSSQGAVCPPLSLADPNNNIPFKSGLYNHTGDCGGSGNIFTPAVIAGISAGILAVIIIVPIVVLALLAVAGKKGYDYYRSRAMNMEAANTNPMYSDNGLTGTNPLAEN